MKATRKQVLGCYKIYGMSEEQMIKDLGDLPEYDEDDVCDVLEKKFNEAMSVNKPTLH